MRMTRAVTAGTAAMVMALGPTAAWAAPAETDTTTSHRETVTFTDVVPCVGEGEDAPSAELTLVYNGVSHTTTKDGTEHFTFTQTGTFSAVFEDGETSRGRFTLWGGGTARADGLNVFTFTFSGKIRSGVGAGTSWHAVDHATLATDEVEPRVAFSRFECH